MAEGGEMGMDGRSWDRVRVGRIGMQGEGLEDGRGLRKGGAQSTPATLATPALQVQLS